MNGILSQKQLNQPGRLTQLILLFSMILIGVILFLFWNNQPPVNPLDPAPVNIESEIEAIYGIHITRLAMTAGGGVVDFRFQVVDPEKATAYMHGDYSDLPVLVVEKDGTRIDPQPHTHHSKYELGRSYYHLYRNPGGIVKVGTKLSIILGKLRLDDVIVQ
jgi:hypothetical protein